MWCPGRCLGVGDETVSLGFLTGMMCATGSHMGATREHSSLIFHQLLLQLRTIRVAVAVDNIVHGRRLGWRGENASVRRGNVTTQCFDLVLELLVSDGMISPRHLVSV